MFDRKYCDTILLDFFLRVVSNQNFSNVIHDQIITCYVVINAEMPADSEGFWQWFVTLIVTGL
jgi:hypothetical protein